MTEGAQVFAISDLHLPGGNDKSMDLFGARWCGHWDKIKKDWVDKVAQDDIVLIPGDISWAMRLGDAMADLRRIAELPGSKVLLKGNHDFWWGSLSRLRDHLPLGMYALQNDALSLGGYLFCGSRGWTAPGTDEDPDDQRIYLRELGRLELSLSSARRLQPDGRMIALCHFPPVGPEGESSPVSSLLERFGVSDAVYGHLHGSACSAGFTGLRNGVRYWFVSCDCLDFHLQRITGGCVSALESS